MLKMRKTDKGGSKIFYEQMISERERLRKDIRFMEEQLQTLPEGKLICTRNHNYFKWYQKRGQHLAYIPKSNRQLAEQLAERRYWTNLQEQARQELHAVEMYLCNHPNEQNVKRFIQEENQEYVNLLKMRFEPKEKDLQEWANCAYKKNEKYKENLIYETNFGIMVRSKSEMLIAEALQKNKIPFHYEEEIQLNGICIYPDFTLRHPKTGDFYCWEHLGMMDVEKYQKNTAGKLELYFSNGYIPEQNLILTSETKVRPMSFSRAERIIEYYFG